MTPARAGEDGTPPDFVRFTDEQRGEFGPTIVQRAIVANMRRQGATWFRATKVDGGTWFEGWRQRPSIEAPFDLERARAREGRRVG